MNNVKIGDFGLASKGLIAVEQGRPSVIDETDMTRSIGTSVYVAPEVKSGGGGNYTSKVDVSLSALFLAHWIFLRCLSIKPSVEEAP